MFTKWYKQILRARIGQASVSGFKAYDGTSFTYYGDNYNGRNTYELALGFALKYAQNPAKGFNNFGYPHVVFGSGRTEPTLEDYKLESYLENVAYTPGAVVKTYGDNQDIFSNTFMITNNGTDTIGVSEVGIFAPASAASMSGAKEYYTMLERSVFEPVYIAPGESATIKYEIVVNYPTV